MAPVIRIRRLGPLVSGLVLLACLVVGLGALGVLRSFPRPARGSAPRPLSLARREHGRCLAIVIDDVGRDLVLLKRLLALDVDLTYAVLPHARDTQTSLEEIRARGREVLLHLPMAPKDPRNITDEPVVLGRDDPMETALHACLAEVPDAVGANNHMGSALSEAPELVARILNVLRRRSLWFLDSRTTGQSSFCGQAKRLKMPCIERDVFLDDPPQSDRVRWRLERATHIAKSRGWAVAVGHLHPATVEALEHWRGADQSVGVCRLSTVVVGRDDS